VGRESYVRRAQARELCDAASGAGWVLGGGGCVRRDLGARVQTCGDVGMAGERPPIALVQPTRGAQRLRRTGAAFERRPRATCPDDRFVH
jgi:hypothetical protein